MYALARDMGRALAENDFMTITGAGNGIMGAAHEGAGLDNSLGFNITLPFEQRSNDVVHNTDHDLRFRFFFLRKLFFVKEADALMREILSFYSNYHSSRWMNGCYLLRMYRPLTVKALEQVSDTFGDICEKGSFRQSPSTGTDPDEPELEGMHCLEFNFNGRHQGRIRALIEVINQDENLESPDIA
jgi:hypothetical protein